MRISLVFPPGWTLSTGSPHLAIPMLAGALRKYGHDVDVHDLNIEWTASRGLRVSEGAVSKAIEVGTLESLNAPYFDVEDVLEADAARHAGEWNAQLGFHYKDAPELSSRQTLETLDRSSPFEEIERLFLAKMLATQPKVIGMCVAASYQLVSAFRLASQLRSAGYDGFIVLGGNTVSRLIKELSFPRVFDLIDGLVVFQGEMALVELCECLERGSHLEAVSQLVWRDEHGVVCENAARPALDPDDAATPDYTGLPLDDYWGERYLCIVAARGCYYGKCSFCAIPYGWGNRGFTGVRSPEKTWRDMLALWEKHGISRFKFVDEALSPHFLQALATIVRDEGVPFQWEGYVRLERSWDDDAFVRHLARGGFRKGYFGLELVPSASRSTLHKNDCPDPERLIALCDAHGIKPHLFCMFGFPGTGDREAADTVEFLLQNRSRVDTADIFPWVLAKHTRVAGVESVDAPGRDWALEFDHRSENPNVLSAEEIGSLASKYEEIIWGDEPRLLHPTYRLRSPWA